MILLALQFNVLPMSIGSFVTYVSMLYLTPALSLKEREVGRMLIGGI